MRRTRGSDMLEVMADHRCDRPACATCDLFGAIPDSLTPEYLTWVSSIRKELLTDPLILSLCPDLVLWLAALTDVSAGAAPETRTCARGACGRPFTPSKPEGRYCSVRCAARARFGEIVRLTCGRCGRVFVPSSRRQRYCDPVCGRRAAAATRRLARTQG